MSDDIFTVTWVDGGLEPQCRPNPNFPQGIDVFATRGSTRNCRVSLPYPARRIGHYEIACRRCGTRVLITTAGRADDPRSVTVPCKTGRPGVNA